ncbi:hypothetical protein GGR58DRAFT_463952 [Xylaria digitata]|nr:hypothetical protein GGR58DRAFT_463952 [Xylaria digitata]
MSIHALFVITLLCRKQMHGTAAIMSALLRVTTPVVAWTARRLGICCALYVGTSSTDIMQADHLALWLPFLLLTALPSTAIP